jgi:hypothetical protein
MSEIFDINHREPTVANKTKTMPTSFRGYGWRKLLSSSIDDRLYEGYVANFGYTRTGGNQPLYRKIIRAGGNASTGMAVTVTGGSWDPDVAWTATKENNKNTPQGLVKVVDSWGFTGVPFTFAPTALFGLEGSSHLVDACANANRQLHKLWTSRRRQFQGGVVIAELEKTLAMVIKPAKALRSKASTLTSRLMKIRKRAGRGDSIVKTMADTWLETTFGWKPLIADVKDGAKAVARVATRDALERQQFRAYGDAPSTVQTSDGTNAISCVTGGTLLYLKEHRQYVRNSLCIIYGVWQTKLQDSLRAHSTASRLATLSGLNWGDIAPQVWEVIPWSFLVDYFVNVGDVIEASSNVFDQPAWMEEVDIEDLTRTATFTPDPVAQKANYGVTATVTGESCTRKESYRQIVRGSFNYDKLYPTLRFQLPISSQWLNIAALVAGGRSFQPFSSR